MRGLRRALWMLVVLGACAPAGTGRWQHIRLRRYLIGDGRTADTEMPVAILWRSDRTHDDCQAQMRDASAAARSDDEATRVAGRRQVDEAFFAPQIASCGEGNVLALHHNEQVEVLDDPGPCGSRLLHVHVERNRDPRAVRESTGCVDPAYVTTEPQEALPRGQWVLVIPMPAGGVPQSSWKPMDPPYDTMLACEQHRLSMKQYVLANHADAAAVRAIEAGRCLHDEDAAKLRGP